MSERSTIEGLERGVSGTRKTLDKMHELVAKGKLDPTMQRIATWIRLQVPKDKRASTKDVLNAVFWWVKKHGIFQRDPFQIEKIEHPIAAMRPIIEARRAGAYDGPGLFVGDCDTIAGVYTATLLGVLGFMYAWETAKVDTSRPDEFSHVWVAARVGGDWYPLDPSTSGATPGWRPPVPPDKFARWPEKPIEDVVGGNAMSGLGDDGNDNGTDQMFYPEVEYGYGIPKNFGPGPGVIQEADAADLQLLPPHDTEIPEADLQPGLKYIRARKALNPSDRLKSLVGQPDSHGPPYYRDGPVRGGEATRQRYIKIESSPYPPGSLWNKTRGLDARRYVATGPTIQKQQPGTPERQVHAMSGQPMRIRRQNRDVLMMPASRVPAGMGDIPGMVTTLDDPTPTQQAATQAGSSVLDSIAGVIKSLAAPAAGVASTALQTRAAQAVVNATNKVLGKPAVAVAPVSSIWKSPWLWLGGAAVLGGVGYVVLSSRGGSSSRRRRR